MRNALRTAIAILVCTGLLGAMGTAFAASFEEQDFVTRINRERTTRGLKALALDSGLSNVARNHSQDMASQNTLYHNPNLGDEVSGWRELGENVGEGGDVEAIHTEFMRSSSHRDEVLYSNYTKVGVGTVWNNGTLWVTEVFFRPMKSSSTAPRTTTTTATSRPRTTARGATPARSGTVAPAKPKPFAPAAPTAPVAVVLSIMSSARLDKLLGDLPVTGPAGDLAVPAGTASEAGLALAAPPTLGSVLWQHVDPA